MEKELLYIGSNGHVAAVDPATGEEAWRTALAGSGFFASTGSQDVTVIQHENRVFAGCYGHLFCLDAATGQIIWQNGLKGLGYNDVTLSIGGKSIQFVSSHSHSTTHS
ncbi:MAG TPA: PQQ-binding-like beta-propeller repeat protein [Longimicrobium sp.]|nr:PQQ-binding-like beta-propeller repeat protein [Longimicrobium sp.]